ncbi:MAG: TldD/PmbA family protein, partial [Promethearchaeota archaeon]
TAKGNGSSEQKYLDLTLAGGWERIRDTRLVERVKDEVERLKKAAETAVKIEELLNQPIDMIVGHEVAGIIAHENVGHPSEGDRIMGREGAQAGESFWRDLEIGESRVGSNAVNVSEDPTIPNTSGYYLYDDEGVKARKRVLIKNGILNEPLLNREFGVKFGVGSNAAARSTAYNREPIIRMANTYFEAGDHTFDELVEDVKLGVYMRGFKEWNIDDRRYQSKYTGSEAYLIKNGEITDSMVRRPIMETTSIGLLTALDAVTKDLNFAFPGTCGKGDPAQGVPVFAGGGEIRFREIRLGGVG